MSTSRLVDLDVAKTLSFQPLRSNDGGKGRTAYINTVRGIPNLFQCPDMRMNFDLKPGMGETSVKEYMKMKLVLSPSEDNAEEAAAAIAKLMEVDDATVKFIWEKRNQIYPPEKLKFMTDMNASLMPSFNPLVKDGKPREDGSFYPKSFTIQVPNLAPLVDHLVIEKKEKDGKTEDVCKSVVWKDMLVNDYKPPEKQPTMYLCHGKNEVGQDIISKTITMRRPDGSVVLDASGAPVKRWVGPQDMPPGSIVRPVFKFSKVYVIAGFGTHIELAAIIIKPPPTRVSPIIDGAVEMENFESLVADKVVEPVKVEAEVSEVAPAVGDVPVPALESFQEKSPKRKAEEPGAPPRKKKKSEE